MQRQGGQIVPGRWAAKLHDQCMPYLRRGRPIAVLPALVCAACAVAAETPTLPAIEKLRYQEDYSDLRSAPRPQSWPAKWKYIPLSPEGDRYLTIGGEIRQRYEYTGNPQFGADPQDVHGVWLQRYSILSDWQLGKGLRLFAQLTSALETGRAGGPSPVDEDRLAWQNAFADLPLYRQPERGLTLRAGRQEIVLGSGRLVDVREGPDVRRTFDGARALGQVPGWQVSALAVRPRRDRPGVFDDGTNSELGLWGLYATGDQLLPLGNIDLYYLGYENDDAVYVQGSGRELRHSLGARIWGADDNWHWNWEALYQFGHFASGDIRAWTLATETAYRWTQSCWQPQLRLSINIASGDKNPDDANLQTFNPLFPRGNYFSEAAVLGPRNFYNFHTFVDLQPTEALALTADLNFFWRLQAEDGLYSPSGQIVRYPDGSNEHFVGAALSLTGEYSICRGLVFTAIHTFFNPGNFIRDTGPSENLGFTELTLQYRF